MLTSLRTRTAGRFARTGLTRHVACLTYAVAISSVVACTGDRVAGPATELERRNHVASADMPTKVDGLRWLRPVTTATASRLIGPTGATIALGGSLTLVVPPGAVTTSTLFSVTRIAGNLVAYDFQPHGLTFARPLLLAYRTSGTNFFAHDESAVVRGAYFADESALAQGLGAATVSEFRPTVVSRDRSTVYFTVNHFSGYMVSMD